MLQIPLIAVPSQTLSIVLDGQSCQIAVYQKQPITDEYGVAAGLFFDLIIGGVPIINTARCLDHRNFAGQALSRGPARHGRFCVSIRPRPRAVLTFNGAPPYYTGLGALVFIAVFGGGGFGRVGRCRIIHLQSRT